MQGINRSVEVVGQRGFTVYSIYYTYYNYYIYYMLQIYILYTMYYIIYYIYLILYILSIAYIMYYIYYILYTMLSTWHSALLKITQDKDWLAQSHQQCYQDINSCCLWQHYKVVMSAHCHMTLDDMTSEGEAQIERVRGRQAGSEVEAV